MPTDNPGPAGTPSVWLVSFSSTDDRELSRSEIALALSRGEITGDTIVWTEGMSDWLPIAQVPPLAALLPAGGGTAGARAETGGFLGTGMGLAGASPPKAEEEPREAEAPAKTDRKSVKPPLPAKRSSAPPPPPKEEEPEPISVVPLSASDVEPPSPMPGPSPLGGGTFGMGAQETQKATPKPPRPPAVRIEDAQPGPAPGDEDMEPAPSSGTPALAQLASLPPKQDRTVDPDIMALGSGSPAVMAPPTIDISSFTAEAAETPEAPEPERPRERHTTPPTSEGAKPFIPDTRAHPAPVQKSSSVMPWLVALGAAGIAGWALLGRQSPAEQPPAPQPPAAIQPAATTPVPAPEPVPTVAPPEPATSVLAPPTPAASVAPLPTFAAPVSPAGSATRPATAPTQTAPASTSTAAAAHAAPAAASAAPTATAAAPAAPAATGEAPAGDIAVAGPFDRSAAAAALNTQAGVASGCRKEGDPSGRALVTVTFANSGRAVRATVDGPPFAGTATGGCIASAMRSAQVPPFSGERVTVTKTVDIH